ncbi:hypothetical protein GFM09_34610 [Rhizobium leguminosarum bv. viciae]|uniref:hypothetical protein n=1 Tax=Rhizobium leguminosarum TaxID=384 RepID=UPI0014415C74|nr:hypothetical protein [Rhizobium leguminosarum]NKL74274.1 hypothetical protein [Rhizobium leguminosarum bv. viciae]
MRSFIAIILIFACNEAFACEVYIENRAHEDIQFKFFDVQNSHPLMNESKKIKRGDGMYVDLFGACGKQLRVEYSGGNGGHQVTSTFAPARVQHGVPVYEVP